MHRNRASEEIEGLLVCLKLLDSSQCSENTLHTFTLPHLPCHSFLYESLTLQKERNPPHLPLCLFNHLVTNVIVKYVGQGLSEALVTQ